MLLASNSLSHLHWDREPDLPEDMGVERPFDHHQYAGDMELLQVVREGPTERLRAAVPKHIAATQAETKAGSLTWLLAAMGWPAVAGDVLAYGTVIATGNAVVEWVPVAAALVPGMPHLLAADPAPSLAGAGRRPRARWATGCATAASRPCSCSRPSGSRCWATRCSATRTCRGTRTDENWYAYDYGHLRYDLAVDAELAHAWADAIDAAGLQARRTRYDGLPRRHRHRHRGGAARPVPAGHGLVQPVRRPGRAGRGGRGRGRRRGRPAGGGRRGERPLVAG